jgi:transposase
MEEQGVLIELERSGDGTCAAEQAPRRKAESAPKIKRIDRDQSAFVSLIVENLVGADDKVRAIWELTGRMDLSRLYEPIVSRENEAGQAAEDPRLLVAIRVWSYSEGISSSRQVEHLIGQEPALLWLCGLRTISHATLANFRKDHKAELDDLFTQLLAMLETAGAIRLERVMHDGTKIRAQAGADTFRREGTLRANLDKARAAVEQMADGDTAPAETKRQHSARRRAARELQERLEAALRELAQVRAGKKDEEEKENARVSGSEPEARMMKHGDQAIRPSYNAQISTDAESKAIVAAQLTQDANDMESLEAAMDLVQQNMGREPEQVVADGGYTTRDNIVAMKQRGIDFIGSLGDPAARQAAAVKARGIDPRFAPQFFILQPETNTLCCPAGKQLRYVRRNRVRGDLYHRYQAAGSDCSACAYRSQCCPKKPEQGRAVALRVEEAADIAEFRRRMETEQARGTYRQRAEVAEFPNAWLKEKIGLRKFSLRGMVKAGIELTWACLTYNVMLWIRVCWGGETAARA